MKKQLVCMSIALAAMSLTQSAFAQAVNLLAEKPIYTLGAPKTWTGTDGERTFDAATLNDIVAVPTNTKNIFLFYEGGGFNTPENQEIGIQGFYVDMQAEQEVAQVVSTWEGAAASAYVMYLTNDVPTLDILNTEPTYSAEKLGQYQENKAVLPEGSKGRYLVFQPTDATNYGWGVKIRSMSAFAPYVAELASFSATPSIVALNSPVALNMVFSDQTGEPIDPSKVTLSVSDNATLVDGVLTITEGNEATITAKMGDKELSCTVAAVSEAPGAPGNYKTPIFLSGDEQLDSTVDLMLGYNGGATRLEDVVFANGEIAMAFTATRCVFFGNKSTLGAWNTKIAPAEDGYRMLHLQVYPSKDVNANICLEGAGDRVNNYFSLTAGKWNDIDLNIASIENINNYSLRFNEADMCDVLVSNIYFTASYVEGDEKAPVLETIVAEAGQGNATLSLKATDDLNDMVTYTIAWGDKKAIFDGKSGEEVTYTIDGLDMSTEYTFTVTASDGLNVSQPQTVTVKTLGIADAPVVVIGNEDDVVAVFSYSLNATAVPGFDAWGSAGKLGTVKTDNGESVLSFTNYEGQWGGLNLDVNLGSFCNTLHIDLMPLADIENGSIIVAPVWKNATGDTPNKTVFVKGNEWNHIEVSLTEFGYPAYGTEIGQFAINHPNFANFLIGNFYFKGNKSQSGVEGIDAENGVAEYYNLQGVRVANPAAGVYVKVAYGKATKVVIK